MSQLVSLNIFPLLLLDTRPAPFRFLVFNSMASHNRTKFRHKNKIAVGQDNSRKAQTEAHEEAYNLWNYFGKCDKKANNFQTEAAGMYQLINVMEISNTN